MSKNVKDLLILVNVFNSRNVKPSGITKWECGSYSLSVGQEGSKQSTIPDALRCWGYGLSGYGNRNKYYCSGHRLSSSQTISDISILSDYYKISSYSQVSDDPNLSSYGVIHNYQISAIQTVIKNEIAARKQNPMYQQNAKSEAKTTVYSTPIDDLPNIPYGSPANTEITNTTTIAYKQLIETLETYIKNADKEGSQYNLSGMGPATEKISFNNNIMSASQLNTLVDITLSTLNDCICYSDCNAYWVCYCHIYCQHYGS